MINWWISSLIYEKQWAHSKEEHTGRQPGGCLRDASKIPEFYPSSFPSVSDAEHHGHKGGLVSRWSMQIALEVEAAGLLGKKGMF